MLVQALIEHEGNVLMVRQYIRGGALVWTLPGGSVEEGETYREAIIREVWEETGYHVEIGRIILDSENKVVYEATVTGGEMYLDTELEANYGVVDVSWLEMGELDFIDEFNLPAFKRYLEGVYGRV